MDLDEQHFLSVAGQVMTDRDPLPVLISMMECWLLISGIQLATRHPDLTDEMKGHLEDIGRQFQEAVVAKYPDAETVLEAGWNLDFDVDSH